MKSPRSVCIYYLLTDVKCATSILWIWPHAAENLTNDRVVWLLQPLNVATSKQNKLFENSSMQQEKNALLTG